MATIATQGTGLRHVRKTIAFDGSANNGNLGDAVTVFITTGRVQVEYCTGYISSGITCAAAAATNIDIGTATNPGAWSLNTTVDNVTGGAGWLIGAGRTSATSTSEALVNTGSPQAASANILLTIFDNGGGADVTAGTIIIDCWYRPITDDGALAGDDIDTELVAAIWAYATRILTALDEDSTTLDLDATIRAAVGMASANLDTQLDAIPTAAEINAEVVDALATDTYAEPSAVPAATSSLKDKIGYLFAKSRNKRTQTATTETILRDDGSTTLGTSTKSDDGTTFTKGEDT